MVRSRIIKIDCALYEAKTEKSHIEVQIPLRIAGDRSHMVKSGNFRVHGLTQRGYVGTKDPSAKHAKERQRLRSRASIPPAAAGQRLALRYFVLASFRVFGGSFLRKFHKVDMSI